MSDILRSQLCYIHQKCAYFTTATMEQQAENMGNEWSRGYYANNSSAPYSWDGHTITKVFYSIECGDLQTPEDMDYDTPYSVNEINSGVIAWLHGKIVNIMGGTTLEEFVEKVKEAGGEVYLGLETMKLLEGSDSVEEMTKYLDRMGTSLRIVCIQVDPAVVWCARRIRAGEPLRSHNGATPDKALEALYQAVLEQKGDVS